MKAENITVSDKSRHRYGGDGFHIEVKICEESGQEGIGRVVIDRDGIEWVLQNKSVGSQSSKTATWKQLIEFMENK